jgi:hypothetical protein
MDRELTYTCATCGETHTGLPDLAFDAPFHYRSMTEEDRRRLAILTSDTCVIAGEDYFVRGCLQLPIHGHHEPFTYGVWVSLSAKNFRRFEELFESKDPVTEPPYFGWFSNRIDGYPETLNLKARVMLRQHPLRPLIELEPGDHPLAVDQRNGITIDRVLKILEAHRHH